MKLNGQRYGEGESLIILHGLFGASSNWGTLAKRVFAPHLEVHVVDQRNHGRSPHDSLHTYAAMASDLKEYIADNDLGRVHLMGHSMGGKVAMEFASTWPELVRTLTIIDIAPRAYPPGHLPLFDAMEALDTASLHSRREADERLQAAIPNRGVRLFLLTNLVRAEGGGYSWRINLDALRKNYENMNGVPASASVYQGPALFVRGGRSTYLKPDDEPFLQGFFPNAKMESIESAGHWVHSDAPKQLSAMVLAFIKAAH